jgi:hypothetical protein
LPPSAARSSQVCSRPGRPHCGHWCVIPPHNPPSTTA